MPCFARTGSRDAAAAVVGSVGIERGRGAGAVIDVAIKNAIASQLDIRRVLLLFMEVIIVLVSLPASGEGLGVGFVSVVTSPPIPSPLRRGDKKGLMRMKRHKHAHRTIRSLG